MAVLGSLWTQPICFIASTSCWERGFVEIEIISALVSAAQSASLESLDAEQFISPAFRTPIPGMIYAGQHVERPLGNGQPAGLFSFSR
jgi:hypothetical protein